MSRKSFANSCQSDADIDRDTFTVQPSYELTRDVTPEECHWLTRSFKAGERVRQFSGVTYGVVGAGIACSMDGKTPFFELPRDALRKLPASTVEKVSTSVMRALQAVERGEVFKKIGRRNSTLEGPKGIGPASLLRCQIAKLITNGEKSGAMNVRYKQVLTDVGKQVLATGLFQS